MAQTIRTLADIMALLATTGAGTISATDVRDAIISVATGQTGFADYADSATASTPITLSAGVWTDLTNDKLGANTRTDYPIGVTSLFNSSTNKIDLSELPIDSFIDYRIDLDITTLTANTDIDARISFAEGHEGAFQVPLMGTLPIKTAGTHDFPVEKNFYVGPNVNDNPGSIQIRAEKNATCVVNGWVQFVNLRGKRI